MNGPPKVASTPTDSPAAVEAPATATDSPRVCGSRSRQSVVAPSSGANARRTVLSPNEPSSPVRCPGSNARSWKVAPSNAPLFSVVSSRATQVRLTVSAFPIQGFLHRELPGVRDRHHIGWTCSSVQTSKSLQPERRTSRNIYVGLAAHVSSCMFGVVGPSGQRLRAPSVTHAEAGGGRSGECGHAPPVPRGRDAVGLASRGALAARSGTGVAGGLRGTGGVEHQAIPDASSSITRTSTRCGRA
jgi:hypothetical protein